MNLKRLLAAALAVLIIAFSFSACEESYKEAYIYIEFNKTAQILDPQLASNTEELTVVRSIYDTLLRYNEKGEILPSAAQSYSKDGLTYTFKLKKDRKWTDGTPLTSDDFLFAFQRAVDPETSAPYVNSLFSIKGAKDINAGKSELSSLGVTAPDKYTLKIQLIEEDTEFEKILTSAITMPCNRDYFESTMGKYGLTLDTTPSCGSYYVKKWTSKEKFLIRLAKNLDYTGDFEANSMRVYFTCGEKDALSMLDNENTDLLYLQTADYDRVSSADFKAVSTADTCYALFINDSLSPDIRKALLSTVSHENIKKHLKSTHSIADSIYPQIIRPKNTASVNKYISYDPETAAKLFSQSVIGGTDLSRVTIKYPSDDTAKAVAKSVAAGWQQSLSLFINIEEISPSSVSMAYDFGNYDIIIVPFTASNGILSAYHSELGIKASDIQGELFGNYYCYPLYYSSTNIAYTDTVNNCSDCISNGILDASMLIKKQ